MQFDHRTKFYLENQIKAAISEKLIYELFTRHGWQVYRFGMEYALPGFGKRSEPLNDENSIAIRMLPDFLIVNETEGRSEYLEVKFRSNGFDFCKEITTRFNGVKYPLPNTYFVIVTPENILIQQVKELEKGAELIPLHAHHAFEFTEEIVQKFLQVAQGFLPVVIL